MSQSKGAGRKPPITSSGPTPLIGRCPDCGSPAQFDERFVFCSNAACPDKSAIPAGTKAEFLARRTAADVLGYSGASAVGILRGDFDDKWDCLRVGIAVAKKVLRTTLAQHKDIKTGEGA